MKRLLTCLIYVCLASLACAADTGGYLFATFRGEGTPMTEQVYFMLSEDGRDWQALNNGEPILVSTVGEKGVRDPFIIRSPDNTKFFLIATDLSIHLNHDWGRAVRAGSQSIVVWESEDLVNWSEPRLVKVAPDDAGCTWAPEAVYDEERGEYMVFWASLTARDNFSKHRIWAAHTKDFKTFSEPFIYIEKPNTVIDTTIIRDRGVYYRFTKDERYKAITMETSPQLMGGWEDVSDFSLNRLTGYEGPTCFQIAPPSEGQPARWCLLLDWYSRGKGYQPYETADLATGDFQPSEQMTFPFSPVRHGTVVPVTQTEFDALINRWPTIAPQRIESFVSPDHYVRHANFVLRVDSNVQPSQDADWKIVAGLASQPGSVSIQSVNFPNRFLAKKDNGFVIEPKHDGDNFAARASFLQVPGLADSSAVSFQLVSDNSQYLSNENSMLVARSVTSKADKERATFRLLDKAAVRRKQRRASFRLQSASDSVKSNNIVTNLETGTVELPVQPGTDRSNLDPQLTASDRSDVSPTGAQDFSKGPVEYRAGSELKFKVSAVEHHNPSLTGYFADPDIIYSRKTGHFHVYPTSDGHDGWSGTDFRSFSSHDLVHWKDDGVILDLKRDVTWANRNAWAPAIIERENNGEYRYYYYFTAAQKIGVAVADHPTGPFVDSGKPLVDFRPDGARGGQEIDPDVFHDPKSGKNFLYWGNGYMAVAELNDDMISIDESTIKIMTPDRTYREGTHVFYRKGVYYFLWSEDDTRSPNYRVRYATATSPTGPLNIPSNNLVIAKDNSQGIYGTGHNSTIQVPGRDEWYIVYHRFNYPHGIKMGPSAGFHREVCIDKMQFSASGELLPVAPTHKGISPVSLPANSPAAK